MPVVMYIKIDYACVVEKHGYGLVIHTQAWASALPSDIDRAMREASKRRTATDTDSYAFLI